MTGINFICMFPFILLCKCSLLRLRGSLLWHDFLQGVGDFESLHHNVSYHLLRCLSTLADRNISRIIADVVNTAMTIVGVQLIDRLGRRRLLLIGAAGMCFCEFVVAIVSSPPSIFSVILDHNTVLSGRCHCRSHPSGRLSELGCSTCVNRLCLRVRDRCLHTTPIYH